VIPSRQVRARATAVSHAAIPTDPLGYVNRSSGWWSTDLNSMEMVPELRWPLSIQVYDKMRHGDAQIAAVLRAVSLPIRRTNWWIDRNGASDNVVQVVAESLNLPIKGDSTDTVSPRNANKFSWTDHLRLAMLEIVFGHMFFEQTYEINSSGLAILAALGPRMPQTLARINVATDGDLESIEQFAPVSAPSLSVVIPANRLVAYVHDRESGNWIGNSLLRPAYKHWLIKDRLLKVQAQTIERNGMGVPRYTGADGATPEALTAGLKLAQGWRSGNASGAAVPFGAKLDLVGVTGTVPDAMPAIDYHDAQIARAVLAHFLNLGQQTGSWALGTTFADFFTLSLQTLAQQFADVATQHIVEDIVDINFGPNEPAPRVVFDEIGSRMDATATAIATLINSGALFPDKPLESALRNQMGLPAADPAEVEPLRPAPIDPPLLVNQDTRTPAPALPPAKEPTQMGDTSPSVGPK
jgi:hypothetical protein